MIAEHEFGPFRLQSWTSLTWPGVLAPAFALIREPRLVHAFSLGFTPPRWRRLWIDTAVVAPPTSLMILKMEHTGVLPHEGLSSVMIAARVDLPRNLRLSLGRSLPLALANARGLATPMRGRGPMLMLSGRLR